MKVLSIVGARPQFVKAAVVSKQIRASGFEGLLLHTGQHYDFNMSEVFIREPAVQWSDSTCCEPWTPARSF